MKDASGNKMEAYVYDAAGNILKKTINGKTTTFTYDSANQLISATLPNGTVKDYTYDAAGRMVKEGNKTYNYGWLNKVMSISEGDKTVANFDYTVDGQVAKREANGKTETFVWDDLALIQRDSTELTNEPYVTGGNPILAGDKALFNDMLGSTLGVAANGTYSPINRTSFGEVDNAAANDYNFFTGKPQVEGLGYAFLFRNYSANNGKWLSQDPLGYPDGWNNFAYCNNGVMNSCDPLGLVEVGDTRTREANEIISWDGNTTWTTVYGSFSAVGNPYQRGGNWYQMWEAPATMQYLYDAPTYQKVKYTERWVEINGIGMWAIIGATNIGNSWKGELTVRASQTAPAGTPPMRDERPE